MTFADLDIFIDMDMDMVAGCGAARRQHDAAGFLSAISLMLSKQYIDVIFIDIMWQVAELHDVNTTPPGSFRQYH